jgi:hypothetical protein
VVIDDPIFFLAFDAAVDASMTFSAVLIGSRIIRRFNLPTDETSSKNEGIGWHVQTGVTISRNLACHDSISLPMLFLDGLALNCNISEKDSGSITTIQCSSGVLRFYWMGGWDEGFRLLSVV